MAMMPGAQDVLSFFSSLWSQPSLIFLWWSCAVTVAMRRPHLWLRLLLLGVAQSILYYWFVWLGDLPHAIPPVARTAVTLGRTMASPVPHVLMLTAIVVGVASLAVGLALLWRVRQHYGTLDEDFMPAWSEDAGS